MLRARVVVGCVCHSMDDLSSLAFWAGLGAVPRLHPMRFGAVGWARAQRELFTHGKCLRAVASGAVL